MRDPKSFHSCTEFIAYCAEEFEKLPHTTPGPVDLYAHLCVMQHDLGVVIEEEFTNLTPEWQQYLRDFKQAVDAACAEQGGGMNAKQQARADFLYRAVLARREQDESSEHQQELRTERENRIDRAKLGGLIGLFSFLLLAALFVARTLYVADTNYFEAVRNGDLPSLRYRILLGKPVNSADNNERSGLHHAAELGHSDLVAYLLSKGADATALDLNERSPLHDAVASGRPDIIKQLLEAGAIVDQRSRDDLTPLMELMRQGHDYPTTHEMAKLLLDAGADINASNGSDSVLTYAIIQAQETYARKAVDLVTFLVEAGADVHFSGKNLTTAIGNALLKYIPRQVDPRTLAESDPVIGYLIEQGALEVYDKSREALRLEASENFRL